MRNFEEIRSHLSGKYSFKTNDPYLLSFDLAVRDGRHQGVYLIELEGGTHAASLGAGYRAAMLWLFNREIAPRS